MVYSEQLKRESLCRPVAARAATRYGLVSSASGVQRCVCAARAHTRCARRRRWRRAARVPPRRRRRASRSARAAARRCAPHRVRRRSAARARRPRALRRARRRGGARRAPRRRRAPRQPLRRRAPGRRRHRAGHQRGAAPSRACGNARAGPPASDNIITDAARRAALRQGNAGCLVEILVPELWDSTSGNIMSQEGDQQRVWEARAFALCAFGVVTCVCSPRAR